MERGFQSLLLTGMYGAGDANVPPIATSDETYIHREIEMSYQRRSYEKSVLSSLYYPRPYGSYEIDGNHQSANVCESFVECSKWRCVQREEKLKRLKTEQPSTDQSSFTFSPTNMFGQLPELRSFEQVNLNEKPLKRKFSSTDLQLAQQTFTDLQLAANYFSPAPMIPPKPPVPSPETLSSREKAMRQRRTLGDKARILQTLLPVDRKMDMATVYEETYKYIQFLKAQVTALESMPVSSISGSNFRSENPRYGDVYGGLGKLNRQQLLELLVNSPAAQSILFSNGCCIYSLEQMMMFNNIAGRNFSSDPCMQFH